MNRRKIVLLIGDGFTAGLRHELGLQFCANPMIPASPSVLYLPFRGDAIPEQPLWSPSMFPELHEAFGEFSAIAGDLGPDDSRELFQRFCASMANIESKLWNEGINRTDILTRSPSYQFRVYLFCLFRFFDYHLRGHLERRGFGGWPWPLVIRQLHAWANIVVVSFNYECAAEIVVTSTLGPKPANIVVPTFGLRGAVTQTFSEGHRPVLFLKPHGSISHCSQAAFSVNWRSDCLVTRCDSWPFAVHRYPPDKIPALPDLVPPGHAGSHLANPDPEVDQSVIDAISACDYLIVCGLSGREPDRAEVARYLAACGSPVIHVGLDADRSTPVAAVLRRHPHKATFCDASSEVSFIPAWISEHFRQLE